jgi:hypothetical protein
VAGPPTRRAGRRIPAPIANRKLLHFMPESTHISSPCLARRTVAAECGLVKVHEIYIHFKEYLN